MITATAVLWFLWGAHGAVIPMASLSACQAAAMQTESFYCVSNQGEVFHRREMTETKDKNCTGKMRVKCEYKK